MKAINVKLGEVYAVKVSGKICPVRLDRVHHAIPGYAGGWWGTNLNTGRAVRIKSAAKLRYRTMSGEKLLLSHLTPAPERREDGHDRD